MCEFLLEVWCLVGGFRCWLGFRCWMLDQFEFRFSWTFQTLYVTQVKPNFWGIES